MWRKDPGLALLRLQGSSRRTTTRKSIELYCRWTLICRPKPFRQNLLSSSLRDFAHFFTVLLAQALLVRGFGAESTYPTCPAKKDVGDAKFGGGGSKLNSTRRKGALLRRPSGELCYDGRVVWTLISCVYKDWGLMDQICSRHTSRLLVALLISGFVTVVARAQAPASPTASPTPAVSPAPAASKPAGPTLESPEAADKVVLKVGDQQFTKADIDFLIGNLAPQAQRALETQGKKPLGDQFALVVMLSQQAHLHHLDQSTAFVRKLTIQKQQLEAQAAYEEINQQAKVSPEEVNQYYTAHAADYDEITVRQFVIRKKSAEPKADPAHPAATSGS